MRKLNVTENHKMLEKYSQHIIIPFLDFLIEISSKDLFSKKKFRFVSSLRNLLPENYPDAVLLAENKETKMIELIDELVKSTNTEEIESAKENYLQQNDELNKGINPTDFDCPEPLYKIFSKIFFEVLFDSNECWDYIESGFKFNRKAFFYNFMTKHEAICPLCDIETIVEKSNSVVEHYFPRCKYPYLSMNGYNLISTCNACNKAEEGKGSIIFTPISLPYYFCVGENVSFDYSNHPKHKIILTAPENDEIKNYNKTLKLSIRYENENAAIAGFKRLKADKVIIEKYSSLDKIPLKDAFAIYYEDKYHENFYYFRKYMLSSEYN